MMEVAKEGFQFLTVTDAFVRPGLEETLQSEEFLGRKAGDEKASIQLDAQEIKNCTRAFDFLQGQWDPQAGGGGPDGAKVVVAFPGVRSAGC